MDIRARSEAGAASDAHRLADLLAAQAARGEPIAWSPGLSVGVDSIDGQHRVLIAYINQLSGAISRAQSGALLGQVLAGLEGYTRLHFQFEERLFDRLGWQAGAEHAQGHRMFERQLADFRARFAAGDTEVAASVLSFLVHWLAGHILVDDLSYSDFMREHAVR
jgi:hemerythrin-like metal-binding protein